MASFGSQLKALLLRNLLLKKRNKKQLIQELFYPVYFTLILVLVKTFAKPKTNPPIREFPSYGLNDSRFSVTAGSRILVTPDSPEVRSIMADVGQFLGNVTEEYFASQAEAEAANEAQPGGFGVIFHSTGSAGDYPSYSLRVPYNKAADTTSLYKDGGQCRNAFNASTDQNCWANKYLTSRFSSLQNAIEAALIKFKSSSFLLPEVLVKMMPKGEFTSDLTAIQSLSSVYFVMAYSFFINFLAVNLVAEKEKKIREGMKMMGLRDSVFWLSWGLVYALLILVTTIVVTILIYAFTFFSRSSNIFIFFLLMYLYGLTIINLAFMVTPFFKKAQVAGVVTGFATIAVSCLYFAVSMTRDVTPNGYHYTVPPGVIWLLCLLSPVAVAFGIDQGIYLDTRVGMTFDNMSQGEFPMYAPFIMLCVDIVLYGLLAVYLDHVLPGEYGPRYPPYYFLMPSYYKQQKSNKSNERTSLVGNSHENINSSSQGISDDLEPVSPDLKDNAGLRCFNISKMFKGKDGTVHAVKDFSLDMYEGHITALLGHNGAGKTTLINMLCGLSPPTKGSATIYGMDVSNSGDMERIRTMCGVCPQHNILYDDLTTMEHLKVFAGIKGVPADQQEAKVTQAMKDADISDKADTLAKNLSGGQKRKLSVAMALIGDPKIIFLDEPTAGMDPYSRRHLWSLLQKSKHDRIILLTTHFMDEADILADRKAIVNHGKLRCCGSSLFLKNRFGIGYHLNMVVEPNCDSSQVTELLGKHVTGVEMKRSHAKELAFTMPLAQVSSFSHMFSSLEETVNGRTRAESLGIKSYGVSMTTLEEVFLKLGDDEQAEEAMYSFGNPAFRPLTAGENIHLQLDNSSAKPNTGSQVNIEIKTNPDELYGSKNNSREVNLPKQRFLTMMKIRFLLHRRSPLSVIFQVILPILFVVLGCVLNKVGTNSSDASNPDPLPLRQTASSYALARQHTGALAPSLVVMDSQGDATSGSFIQTINGTWKIDTVNNSVNLLDLPNQHFLGFNLDNWQGSPNYGIGYTALYNDTAVHSLPVIINLMSSAIYSIVTSNNTAYISGSSLPWPSLTKTLTYNGSAFSATMILALAFVLVAPGFAVHLVQDRQLKCRSQLRVAGISFNCYWGSIFLLHLAMSALPAVVCLIIVGAVKIDSLNYAGALVSIIFMFITFIPTMILFSYVLSFGFDKYETCQAILPNLSIFSSLLPYIGVSMADMLGSYDIAKVLHYIFVVIDPPYALSGGLYYVDRIYRLALIFNNLDIPFERYFEPESNILVCILMPLVHMVWLYILLRIFDVRNTGGTAMDAVKCGKESKVADVPEDNHDLIEDEDQDVKEERNRVTSLDRDHLVDGPVGYVKNLRKEFRKDNSSCCKRGPKKDTLKVAVRNATFAVDGGEVFGLLGPNGAGKTTTLNMIIAETGQTRGKVMVAGHNVHSSLSEAFQAMGYCPQHDALWEDITLREHIESYALIRGLTPENSVTVANSLIEGLKVEEHANKKAKKLSGGTKRKLSYALSMLGTPEIVLLDEPSTGMDPKSKRFLWDTISSSFQDSKRGAILTTHYMEEADALCSRVAIMVNGEIQCLGPTQHLKDKFGSGYLLEVKLKNMATTSHNMEERMDNLESHILDLFPHATAMERFQERGMYKIPKQDVTSLAQTFSHLEETKLTHDVEEYSFSQSTLEQVFLDFAKRQHEEGSDEKDLTKKLERQLSGGQKSRPVVVHL